MNLKKLPKRLFALTMALLIVSSLFGGAASAEESTRIARIDSVSGEVMVKKAGGSKEFKAYKNMTLNQGDHIRTGSDSSAVLTVLDQEDKITIGSNTSMYLSELKDSGGGKSTKMNLWNGSAYVNASKKNSNDQFRVETPTAVMGIRGTHFTVSHTKNETDIIVHSGVVEATVETNEGQGTDASNGGGQQVVELLLFPTMQAYITRIFDELQGAAEVETTVSVVDVESLKMDLAILYAVVENKQAIDTENEQVLQQIQSGEIPLPPELDSPQELEALAANVTQFVAAIVQSAVRQELITEEEAQQLAAIGNIDLSQPAQLQLTEEQRQRQQQLEEQKRRAQQQAEQEEQRMQELQQQYEELLNRIRQTLQQQEEQNQATLNQIEQEALERFLASLTEEEREQFLQRRQQLTEGTETSTPPAGDSGSPSGPSGPSDPGQPAPQLAIANVQLANRGDYVLEYHLSVMLGNNPVTSLQKSNFQIKVDNTALQDKDFDVDFYQYQNSSYYDLDLRFPHEPNTISSLEIQVTHNGQTAKHTIDGPIQVKGPSVEFKKIDISDDKYEFRVFLNNLSNVLGVQIHVVFNEEFDLFTSSGNAFPTVTATETEHYGWYDGFENYAAEIIYAYVLTPGESAEDNDIGDLPTTPVYSVTLEYSGDDEGRVVLARVIVVTGKGEEQAVYELIPDPAEYTIEPSVGSY